jgi:RNA polymerase sigma factor (sigma-70 family)
MTEVTQILKAIGQGDPRAADQLWPLVYDELRRLAARKMAREAPGQTLDATALVHEAYLRLVGHLAPGESPGAKGPGDSPGAKFAGRGHFFAAAAEAMRRILVENARRKGREKHGGGRRREPADLDALSAADPETDLLALHEALERFAAHDPRKAKLVELRYFGGLTLEQAADCLDISRATAVRDWLYARAWLFDALAGDQSEKN